MQSGLAQRSVLRPVLFNFLINDVCDIIKHSNCLLLVDDLKAYRAISSPNDCLLLQSDIDRVHNWLSANFMKINFSKIEVIPFARKKKVLNYRYRLSNSFMLRTDLIKDLGVRIDCKLHFHRYVDIFSHMH
jgi:hypothetical protein